MSKTIEQKVKFNISAAKLYGIYMDAKKHSLAIEAPVKISKKTGAKFSSHGDYIVGKNLHLVPNQMIVQTWRGSDWAKSAQESILILTFSDAAGGCELKMIHSNLPDEHADSIKGGWNDYYWKPMKNYIKSLKK